MVVSNAYRQSHSRKRRKWQAGGFKLEDLHGSGLDARQLVADNTTRGDPTVSEKKGLVRKWNESLKPRSSPVRTSDRTSWRHRQGGEGIGEVWNPVSVERHRWDFL